MTAQPIPLPRSTGAERSRRPANALVGPGPRVVPLVFYTALVIALFFAMIYLRIALDRTAFELDNLERTIEMEESRTLDLRLQIAQLQDPIRIANEAERLGMTHPGERHTLVIGERPVGPAPTPDVPVSAHEGSSP